MSNRFLWLFLAVCCAAPLWHPLSASLSGGEHSCCHRCEGRHHVCKVCRVVCEMKEVKEVTYDIVCEDYCLAGGAQKCGCQKIPKCGKSGTKKQLVKIETVKKVPSYKCVVEHLCSECCSHYGAVPAPAGAPYQYQIPAPALAPPDAPPPPLAR